MASCFRDSPFLTHIGCPKNNLQRKHSLNILPDAKNICLAKLVQTWTKTISENSSLERLHILCAITSPIRVLLSYFQLITHFAYRRISDTYTEGEKCALHELHILPFPILAIPVKKYSPYKEIVGEKYVTNATFLDTERGSYVSMHLSFWSFKHKCI